MAESLLDLSLKVTGVDFKSCRDPATHHGGKKWVGIKTGEGRMETKLLHLSLRGQLLKQWDRKVLKEKGCRSCYKRECGRVKKQNEQISTRPGAHPTLHNEAESREDRMVSHRNQGKRSVS